MLVSQAFIVSILTIPYNYPKQVQRTHILWCMRADASIVTKFAVFTVN